MIEDDKLVLKEKLEILPRKLHFFDIKFSKNESNTGTEEVFSGECTKEQFYHFKNFGLDTISKLKEALIDKIKTHLVEKLCEKLEDVNIKPYIEVECDDIKQYAENLKRAIKYIGFDDDNERCIDDNDYVIITNSQLEFAFSGLPDYNHTYCYSDLGIENLFLKPVSYYEGGDINKRTKHIYVNYYWEYNENKLILLKYKNKPIITIHKIEINDNLDNLDKLNNTDKILITYKIYYTINLNDAKHSVLYFNNKTNFVKL